MDQLDLEHGLRGMLLSLIGLVAANVLAHIVKGFWAYYRRNIGPTQDQFRSLTEALKETKAALDGQKLVMDKISQDIRRIYLFLKVMAGERWPKLYKKVKELEENPH